MQHIVCATAAVFLPLTLQQLPKVLSRPPSGEDLQEIMSKDLAWCTIHACLFQRAAEPEQLLDSMGFVDK